MPTHDVKIKDAPNDPKNTSPYHMGHGSAPRGVCNVFDIPLKENLDPPKHVLERQKLLPVQRMHIADAASFSTYPQVVGRVSTRTQTSV